MASMFDEVYAYADLLCMHQEDKSKTYAVEELAERWRWDNYKTFLFIMKVFQGGVAAFNGGDRITLVDFNIMMFRHLGVIPPPNDLLFPSEKFRKAYEKFRLHKVSKGISTKPSQFKDGVMARLKNLAGRDEELAIAILEDARKNNRSKLRIPEKR